MSDCVLLSSVILLLIVSNSKLLLALIQNHTNIFYVQQLEKIQFKSSVH